MTTQKDLITAVRVWQLFDELATYHIEKGLEAVTVYGSSDEVFERHYKMHNIARHQAESVKAKWVQHEDEWNKVHAMLLLDEVK